MLGEIPRLASLTPLSLRHQREEGSLLVDTRPQKPFNEGHIADSFSVPLGDNFATWVGWVVPWQQPLVFLSPDPASHDSPASRDSIVRQLIRIGYDRFNGYLGGGLEAWQQAGLSLESANRIDLEDLHELSGHSPGSLIIDVRQSREFQAGHISGSLNIELGSCPSTWTACPGSCPSLPSAPPACGRPSPAVFCSGTGVGTFASWMSRELPSGLAGVIPLRPAAPKPESTDGQGWTA